MRRTGLYLFIVIWCAACSRKTNPSSSVTSSATSLKPSLEKTDFKLDSLPDSEINIPVRVSLKPFYAMAEKNIDTVYTSPNYPKDWINADCATRYKYHFRRGPLQLSASGTVLNLSFTGFYQIIGSTRACINNTIISPWTPPCNCGFDEGERKVNVSFSNSVFITPDYKIKLTVNRLEPQPIDKCTVCFWGQDITSVVMTGLKANLDFAKQEIDKSYGTIDLRSKFQQIWNRICQPYSLYNLGWLQVNPRSMRLNSLFAKNDSLYLNLGLSAHPVIGFEKPLVQNNAIPNLSTFSDKPGFNIFLDAVLNYDSLSNIVNAQIRDKRFDFKKGPVSKYVIIKDCKLLGMNNEKLIIQVNFTGSYDGLAYFTGIPVYDEKEQVIEMKDVDFDVKSKAAILKTAEWLFNKRITNELKKYSRFDLTGYIDTAKTTINQQLNKEWIAGIKSNGKINDIKLVGIYPTSKHLVIRSNCSGDLAVVVESVNLSF